MFSSIVKDLGWLKPVSTDYLNKFSTLEEAKTISSKELFALASHSLDADDLESLLPLREKVAEDGFYRKFNLRVSTNGNPDLLAPAIEGSGLRHRLNLRVKSIGLGQGMASLYHSPEEEKPDGILIAFDHRAFPLDGKVNEEAAALLFL